MKRGVNLENESTGLTIKTILKTSSQLFAKKGYRASSLNDVAAKLCVSKPALYYHFKNKHEILNSIFTIIMEIYLKSAVEIQNLDLSPKEKLSRLIESHASTVIEHREYSIIFFTEQAELESDARKKLRKHMLDYEKIFESVIVDGIAQGIFKAIDAHALVMGIFGMTNWLYHWYEPKGKIPKQEISKLYSSLLETGYLA
jgi:TetR/AcrR family transcriptional regulator, cholesterol catabolism regulator